jgi:SPX domain protein involved in polyphosphate accumulation/uncharacterized membrane protein YidH (DUF202 family)
MMMDGGRRPRVSAEDLLVEPLVPSLVDAYLNVEGVLRMMQGAGALERPPVSSKISSSAPATPPDDLVQLIERCLASRPDGAGVSPLGATSPQHFFVFSELQRINRFVRQSLEREWSRLLHASRELWSAVDECALVGTEGEAVEQHVARLRSILASARSNVQDLDAFVRHNVVLGEYVARCLDSAAKSGQSPVHTAVEPRMAERQRQHNLYVVGIERVLMRGVRMSSLLMAMSDLYEGIRVLEVHGPEAKQVLDGVLKASWKAPSKFSRVVKKFWILPKDVMRFKLFVMEHLPILVYGAREKLLDEVRRAEGHMGAQSFPIERFHSEESGEIASVYLDSVPSLQHYQDRLHRRDKAKVTRIRWYGARNPEDGNKSIFIERKTHRNAYSGLTSAKERGCIRQRDVNNFLRGNYTVDENSKDAELLSSVMQEICDDQQEILMRTTYSRTAFQNATENTVRISLDTNVCMTREQGYQTDASWCRNLNSHPLREDDVAQFPYGVVEIKLQASPPQWVRDLVNSGMLLMVPKFSKFLHGTAVLYQRVTENVPYWFLPDPMDKELLTPATWDEMADTECIYAKDAADWLFPSQFELPAHQERHLSLPFFRPKGSRANSSVPATGAGAATGLHLARDPSAREALLELEDESGNRTWCDVETVELEDAEADVRGARLAADAGTHPLQWETGTLPLSTPRKPSWTVYQHVRDPILEGRNDMEHDGSSVDYGTSQTSGSEHMGSESGVTVLPLAQHDKGTVGSVYPQSPSAKHVDRSPYSMSGSFGVMQYSMSMAKDDGDGSDGTSEPNGQVRRKRSASIVRTRVEPKTFFANERTFLQWINVSVLVMFLALSLLSGSVIPGMGSSISSVCEANDARCLAGKMSGAIIAPVALTFMGYALYMYKKRTLQILRRETVRYDDQRGPVVLVRIDSLSPFAPSVSFLPQFLSSRRVHTGVKPNRCSPVQFSTAGCDPPPRDDHFLHYDDDFRILKESSLTSIIK